MEGYVLSLLTLMLVMACAGALPAALQPRHLRSTGSAVATNSSLSAAQPDPSLTALGWLQPPAGGWPVWKLPSQPIYRRALSDSTSSSRESAATLLPAPEQRRAVAQLVAQQIASHLADRNAEQLWHEARSLRGQAEQAPDNEAEGMAATLEVVTAAAAQRGMLATATPAGARQTAAPASSPALRPAQLPASGAEITSTAASAGKATPAAQLPLASPAVARGRTRFPPPFHAAFPPTGIPSVPPPRALGCPLSSSVLAFGASAGGQADCSQALAAADTSSLQMLYFPRGTYRLSRSLVLRRPVVMGINTRFLLDANVRLTLLAQPVRAPKWYDPMFSGPGAGLVRMGGGVREVYPNWWLDHGLTDSNALQFATDSCSSGAGCTVLLSRTLNLPKPVTWRPAAGAFATAQGMLRGGGGGAGKGIVLPAGNYTRPLVFTGIREFRDVGLTIQPGVRNANLQIGQLSVNGNGVVFEASRTAPIYNTVISHVSVFQGNQNDIVFSSPQPGGRLDGVTVRGNFMLKGGTIAPEQPSAGVLFRGAPPNLTSTQVVVQAIDPAQFITPTRFAAARTTTSGPVAGFAFRSEVWNGGYVAPGGSQVDGSFVNSHFLFAFPDQVGGRIFSIGPGSAGNVLRKGDTGEMAAASHFYTLVPPPGSFSAFSAANPVGPLSPVPMPVAHQGFYVTAPITKAWPPGEKRTFYLHSHFAHPGVLAKRLECGLPFRPDNPGLLCLAIAAAPTSTEPHRVALTLANLGTQTLPVGFDLRFGVQLGPG